MFVIFGTRYVVRPSAHRGEFYCPDCGHPSTYVELVAQKYAHLFFVPLIRYDHEPAGLRCEGCHNDFDDSALHYRPRRMQVEWECQECHRQWPDSNICCPICKIRREAPARAA